MQQSRPIGDHSDGSAAGAVLSFGVAIRAFRTDPLGFFGDVARSPDGIAEVRLPRRRLVIVSRPEHVRWMLRDHHRNYTKDAPMYRAARPFLGTSLTVSPGGPDWLRRRRLVQRAFGPEASRVADEQLRECLAELAARWRRLAGDRAVVDASAEMTTLTMRLACRRLFGVDVHDGPDGLAADLALVCDVVVGMAARPFPPLVVPTRTHRRFRAAMRRIRAFVDELVARPRTELVADLLAEARSDGATPAQVRDELVGLFFAGHETLGHTLAWCWHLLATHPDAAETLRAELRARPADPVHARGVVTEAMRLYPVVWLAMRRAVADDAVGDHRIPAGSWLVWSPYAVNRRADVWSEPDAFRPDRHHALATHDADLLPFGLGPRVCPAAGTATGHAVATLAALAGDVRVAPAGGSVRPDPSITLRPAGGVPVRLEPA